MKLGIIEPGGVMFKDNPQNPTGMTVVNLVLLGGDPPLKRVPVMSPKVNQTNGEAEDPEPGDQVVVGFVDGAFWKPLILGFLSTARNGIHGTTAEAPRYYRSHQGTSEKIGKDGSRTIYVAKDDTLTIKGEGTVNISEKNLTINIQGAGKKLVVNGNLQVNGNVTASGDVADQNGTKTMAGMRGVFNADIRVDPQGGTTPPLHPM